MTEQRCRQGRASRVPPSLGVLVVGLLVAGLTACSGLGHPGPAGSRQSSGLSGTVGRPARSEPAPSPDRRSGPDEPLRGSERWRLSRPARDGQIEGYASTPGGLPGTLVDVAVSTSSRSYRVHAYRLGAYQGGSGRRVWSSSTLRRSVQAGPVLADPTRNTVLARWRTSVTVDTMGWQPGLHVFELLSSAGWQAHVPYVVRSPSAEGRVALVAPVTTWQAYNDWGGYSLYKGPPGRSRSHAVSFARPYPAPGSGEMMYGAVPVVLAAERLHLRLAYLTNVDLHTDPDALRGATAYVSMGHDEYWTPTMRRRVLAARDSGTNLVFLGANTMYWRIRLEAAGSGPPLVVGYRSDAASDPAASRAPRTVTARFRDQPAPEPENDLTGMLYECYPVEAPLRVVSPGWWGYHGTQVRHGTAFPHLVGVEADRVYPDERSPRPMQIVADTPYTCGGVPTSAQSVYYTAPSGAGVFNVGTLRWTCALADRCERSLFSQRTRDFVRRVTANVLQAFAAGPAAEQHPARHNVGRFALSPVNQVPAS